MSFRGMRVFVTLQPARDKPAGKTVYALLLPENGEWGEVVVKPSPLQGFGVFPRDSSLLKWSDLREPVLMCAHCPHGPRESRASPAPWERHAYLDPQFSPIVHALRRPYLGVECVTQDSHMLKLLLQVLRGEFELLTVDELLAVAPRAYVQDGLCAVVRDESSPRHASLPVLSAKTELLQVAHSDTNCKSGVRDVCGGGASVCYLLCEDVRELLHLTGSRAHLWELLKAHSRHHHSDRHLATHVAHIWREEEGYVLINAHPAFEEVLSLTGLINEPLAKVSMPPLLAIHMLP